jgi:hypothetical protein
MGRLHRRVACCTATPFNNKGGKMEGKCPEYKDLVEFAVIELQDNQIKSTPTRQKINTK